MKLNGMIVTLAPGQDLNHIGKHAHDGDDRLVYNAKNGELIYQKNGGETVLPYSARSSPRA